MILHLMITVMTILEIIATIIVEEIIIIQEVRHPMDQIIQMEIIIIHMVL